jgi:hypothetical protein
MSIPALSIADIRKNVKKRLGFDPIEVAAMDKKTVYLSRVCAHLPPLGSEAREMLRAGISLSKAMERMRGQGNMYK